MDKRVIFFGTLLVGFVTFVVADYGLYERASHKGLPISSRYFPGAGLIAIFGTPEALPVALRPAPERPIGIAGLRPDAARSLIPLRVPEPTTTPTITPRLLPGARRFSL